MSIKSTTDKDKRIAERVRYARDLKGVTQGELATALGVSFQQVQNMKKAQTASVRVACRTLLNVSGFRSPGFTRWRKVARLILESNRSLS